MFFFFDYDFYDIMLVGEIMIYPIIAIRECSSASLQVFLSIVKKALNIIHIIVPILLMIAVTIHLVNLVQNPDDKKLLPKIRNSILAAAIIFFIPTLVNVVMGMVSNDYDISACWNETIEYHYNSSPSYVNPNDNAGSTSSFISNPDDYQKGNPRVPASSSNSSGRSNSSNNSSNNNDSSSDGVGTLHTNPQNISGDLQVHFINPNSRVDAIYIQAGNESMFIDGGWKGDAKREAAYLDKIGVSHIDYYLASHSHKDHVEAAPYIIQKYGIKKVLVGRETCEGSGSSYCSWYSIKGFANDQGISLNGVSSIVVSPGDSFYLGGLKITCLGPLEITNGLNKQDVKQNNNSLVIRLDYGSTSFALPGDNASSSVIKKIQSKFPGMLNVDVLKNAHHNECTSDSSYQLYSAEHVVFTTRHDYIPASSCINRIKKYGARNYFIVANGYSGNVLFTSDGSSIQIYDHYKD